MRDGLQGLSDGQVESSASLLEVDEASLKANELREGSSVALAPSIPCMVSFSPGQERHVVLGLHGLEQVCCPQHCCMKRLSTSQVSMYCQRLSRLQHAAAGDVYERDSSMEQLQPCWSFAVPREIGCSKLHVLLQVCGAAVHVCL